MYGRPSPSPNLECVTFTNYSYSQLTIYNAELHPPDAPPAAVLLKPLLPIIYLSFNQSVGKSM